MVDYWELNKVVPAIHEAVPSVVDLMDQLTNELGTYHFVADLANAFSSIAIAPESQDQFAFTWEGRQWTFTVFPQVTCTAQPYVMGLWWRTWLSGHGLQKCPSSTTLMTFCSPVMLCKS